MPSIIERFKSAWSSFADVGKYDPPEGPGYSVPYHIPQFSITNQRTIVASINTRIAIDVSTLNIYHAMVDESNRFLNPITSGLNYCLTEEANLDQGPNAFLQDIAMHMCEDGHAAVVPTKASADPRKTNSFSVMELRVGRVTEWFPKQVRIRLYNSETGHYEEILMPKHAVAIITNPLYNVMNRTNSTLQRLNNKIALLDATDSANASDKLNLIIQLPYVIKSDARRSQAEARRKDIEVQLKDSKYGIAYTDGTERITQLNRPTENNLWDQVKELTSSVYQQLGLTDSVMNGTADEATILNYMNRTIEPMAQAIVQELKRKFLTLTARTQGQSVVAMRDPFKYVPLSQVAEVADKLTRNAITTSNEIRPIVGFRPLDDPKANELSNKNVPQPEYEQEF